MTKLEKISRKKELDAIAKRTKKPTDPKELICLNFEKVITKNGIEYTYEETFEYQMVDSDDFVTFELRDDLGNRQNIDNLIGHIEVSLKSLINRAGEPKWYTLFFQG